MLMVVQANTVQSMYIDNRNFPGGPWAYFLATQQLPINVIFYATLFILTFLSDLLVLWRCWVIWTGSGRIIAYAVISFPALCTLASFVMGTLWTLQSSQPGLSLYSKLPMAYGTSYYIISLGINIMLTILITIRLLMYRRMVTASLSSDHAKHYLSLAAILVESAALYSVLAIMFIVTYAINNPLNQIFLGVASAGQQIAGYLIIYRLADGRAWSTDTFNSGSLPPTAVFGSVSNMRMTEISSFQITTTDHIATGEAGLTLGYPSQGDVTKGDSKLDFPVVSPKNNSIWKRFRKSPAILQSTSIPAA